MNGRTSGWVPSTTGARHVVALLLSSAMLVGLTACMPPAAAPDEVERLPPKHLDLDFAALAGEPSAPESTWVMSEIIGLVDSEGYTYDVAFVSGYSDVQKDITYASPGRADLLLTAQVDASITNTTDGRVAPLSNLLDFKVGGAFPRESTLCLSQAATRYRWQPSEGSLGAYCFIFLADPSIAETGLPPGETYQAAGSLEQLGEDSESAVDGMVAELTAGPAFWIGGLDFDSGLVNRCDGGPGTRVVWLSSAVVDCPGAAVATPTPTADVSSDLAQLAVDGYRRAVGRFVDSDGTVLGGVLPDCPFGDFETVTRGLDGAVGGSEAFAAVDISPRDSAQKNAQLTCYSDSVAINVITRTEGMKPVEELLGSDRGATSDEHPYLGGELLVICPDPDDCRPVWYTDEIVMWGSGGAADDPQAQLNWFARDLEAMLGTIGQFQP